jgi:arylsulfatase A-like enzyme
MAVLKSIVLVTVDCLRVDHCSFMGYGRQTTPFLERLAAESFVFPTAIVAGTPTYYSIPAILASRYPLAFGRETVGLTTGEPTLASTLKKAGYATAFFGAANPYLSPHFGYDCGFDTFQDFLTDPVKIFDPEPALAKVGWAGRLNRSLDDISHKLGPVGAAYDELYFQYCQRWTATASGSLDSLRRFPSADVIVDEAVAWLLSVRNEPFFLWLHLMDPHSPYYPTEKGQELLGIEKATANRARYLNAYWNRSDIESKRLCKYRDHIIALYDSGIRWVDEQIARLIVLFHHHRLWKTCVFALTADHGEEFLEHYGRYHAPSSLAEELIHVPLLLHVPEVEKKQISKAPFSLLHLAPTLLNAARLPIPDEFEGQSRWSAVQEGRTWDEPAIVECIDGCTNPYRPESRQGHRTLAVREARYKLVLHFKSSNEYLFDLQTDPHERTPLPDNVAKAVRGSLLKTAFEHLSRTQRRDPRAYLRTRLRDIGLNLAKARQNARTDSVDQMNYGAAKVG